MTIGSIQTFLHDLEHYQHIAMVADQCSEEQLELLKTDLELKKVDQLQFCPVTNMANRAMSVLYKFTGPQVVILYQALERAYHLIAALEGMLHLIEGDFKKPQDAKVWHGGMVSRHAHFRKYLLKNIPIKYREELLGIAPAKPRTRTEQHNYFYIHTLDGFPAFYDGLTVVFAGTAKTTKGGLCTNLKKLHREQEAAVRAISEQVNEAASQQFQTRLGYCAYVR